MNCNEKEDIMKQFVIYKDIKVFRKVLVYLINEEIFHKITLSFQVAFFSDHYENINMSFNSVQ